jgi:hypothetical protein
MDRTPVHCHPMPIRTLSPLLDERTNVTEFKNETDTPLALVILNTMLDTTYSTGKRRDTQ